MSVVSHRKGYRKRPACASGKMFMVTAGSQTIPDNRDADIVQADIPDVIEPASDDDRGAPSVDIPEPTFSGDDAVPDNADEIAVRMLRNLDPLSVIDPARYAASSGTNGHVGPPGVGSIDGLPKGDWTVEEAPPGSPVSEARETVSLPAIVRVMYDWFCSHGYQAPFNEWCFEMINDHWSTCMGKMIMVVDRSDVEGDEDGGANGSGHKIARIGANAQA